MSGAAEDDDLRELDAGARLAVALAEVEARQLGHARVGTEHLFLGLLAEGESRGGQALRAAGVALAAARHKVDEAVGSSAAPEGTLPADALPRTARATRALGRSVRFAHARKAGAVGSEDVLLGVLDVEGTAGQVLRGLGIDVDRLRATLLDGDPVLATRVAVAQPVCPSCSAELARELTYRPVVARGERATTRDAVVFSCGVCGRFLGIAPA